MPGLAGTLTSNYDGHSIEAFAKIGYAVISGSISVVQFARYTHDRTKVEAVTEGTGAAALRFGSDRRDLNLLAGGLRIDGAGFVSQSKQWRDSGAKVSVGFRF